mgnify:FL=1
MKITGVVGVIIVTFIILIVASITYSHVESIRKQQNEKKDLFINGYVENLTKKETITLNKSPVTVWKVTLSEQSSENRSNYLMIFEETYPPHPDVYLRLYYTKLTKDNIEYLWITEINALNQK